MRDFINQRLEKNPLFAWRLIEEMVLLVPIKQSGPEIRRVYRLKDPVSSRIWELVDGQRTDQEIHQALCQEFDTEAQRIKRDLLKFLKHLRSIGAVQVATNSAGKQKPTKSMSERQGKSRNPKLPMEAKVKGPLRLSIGGIELCLKWEEPRRVSGQVASDCPRNPTAPYADPANIDDPNRRWSATSSAVLQRMTNVSNESNIWTPGVLRVSDPVLSITYQ